MKMAETAPTRTLLDFSPVKRHDADKENHVPVLSLIQFSKAPFVSFGTVKVGTSRSAVVRIDNPTEDAEARVTVEKIPSGKGFSVDHNTFTVQPEASFSLTVTWTPAEEGGTRELLVFSANGVLKHQAVLLGRAEAPKKKKKSLWDTIKNKKDGEKVFAPRGKKMEATLKMAANKTFQVSRKPQYKRDKPRSPLTSLNEGRAATTRSLRKHGPADGRPQKPDDQVSKPGSQQCPASSDQENVRRGRVSSPAVLLVPATELVDGGNATDCPGQTQNKPDIKDLTKILNRTLSPIGTPEKFKRLMPRIQSESSVPVYVECEADAIRESTGTPVPSLKDALALIDSDLSNINTSPPDTSSSCSFSDSLESKSGSHVLEALANSPEPLESNEPRLTFFVSTKAVASEDVAAAEMVKKTSFTTATVTKSKASAEENVLSGRKIRKSRRRLLEKTLELSDGSGPYESGPSTPQLPVIDPDSGTEGRPTGLCDVTHQVLKFTSSSPTPPVTYPLSMTATRFSFVVASPSPPPSSSVAFTATSPSPAASSSPLHLSSSTDGCRRSPAPTAQEDSFPIHVVVKSKKRRSEEFLRSDAKAEDAGKTDKVKRSKVVCGRNESWRSERRSVLQRTAGSVRSATTSSLKTMRSAVPGQAKLPSSKFTSRGTPSLKSSAVRAAKVVAVAQSKLTFVKPLQTAIPRHPMPFAAKNMFYDERWIEKQERGFTWWINYVLTPDDFKVNTEVAKVNAVSLAMGNDDNLSVPKAPTKDQMSFSTYTARRKLNRLRRSACQLFTSEPMVRAIQRLELEVEAKRLLVRRDRHLWKDIGERKKVLNWLLSYNPLWLRIGLETIYGELISLESNSDVLGLAVFILRRLLWNPDIAAQFRHNKVPHLYKDGHEEALSRFTLKKLLLLVCFLDKAKESRLIEHDPCLFCVDAEFKTSKDLLLAFSRDFLSGEGILPRHLGYLGLHVSHVQMPLDEFDFAVKNLAVDLKCGIRLVRVVELLVQDWSLSAKLRLPAISRLQKVHNVDVALQMLRNKGVDLKDEHGSVIDARDIVDGHREKTLSLLWKIIFTFHVEVILNEDQLREEISFLRRSRRTKRRLASLRADRGPQPSPAKEKTTYEHSSTKITLLMDWVRTVCDFYNLKVENFTVAFSDGRVLCYLIHHYHPGLLPEEAVRHGTTQTVECSLSGRLELSCSASDSDSSFDCATGPMASPSLEFKELLENEKNNLRLVNTAVGFLGGVPAMINPADMSNTIPNEKVVMSYLTFLCARLLDLRNETRAARVIQDAWRKYRLKKDLQLYEERNSAAVKIQSRVRRFLHERRTKRQNQAAVLIQSVWRSYVARNRLRLKKEAQLRALQHKAAAVIQAQWRMFSALTTYQRLTYYTVVVQAQWRMRRAASAYGRLRWAVVVLQKHSRARALTMKDRESYLSLRAAVVKLQRGYRRWKTQKTAKENRAAAVIQAVFKKWYKQKMSSRFAAAVQIQSWYRKQRCLHQYRKLRRSIVFIQAQCKGHEQRRRFQMLKLQHHSAVLIQSVFRGHVARKQVAKMSCAAVVIQGWFRASVRRDAERQMFVSLRRAAVIIQATYRGKVARQELNKRHQAATVIQAAFREHAARRRYLVIRKAAAVIQQKYRATVLSRKTMKDFESLRDAALTIQAAWRGRADRKRIEKQHQCATVIQAHYRRHKAQTEFMSQKAAAVVVQCHYRAHVTAKETRESFLCKRAACVTLQAAFRGMRVRTELRKKHQAATVVQSAVRMFLCKKRYVLLQSAAVIVQSRYRALLLCRTQQREYRRLKQATIKIQAVYQGFKVRKDLKKSHKAARAIQAHFRMHRTRMAYLATKYAALIIQDRYRAKILRDHQWQRYNTMKSAAVIIQAAYRGHLARRKVAEMHRAATVIQRKVLTMRERNKFLSIKAAAVVCQQRYRAAILVRKDRLDFLSKCRAVVCLQAAYRGYEVRKQLHIQHMAAVTIQSHFRTHQQRIRYKRLRWAVGVLQTRYRANQETRREMHNLRAKRNAAVVLQAAYRGMKCRRSIKQQHRAADVIQRSYRAHCERRQYLALKSSVLSVQRRYRATVAAKQQMHRYQTARRAAVVLQAAFRGRQVWREIALWHQAATVIQSVYKKHRMEIRFQAMRLAAVIIQTRYRAQVLQRQDRENFLKMRRSAVVLQAAFRGQRVRNNISKMHMAATVIQTNYRRYKQQSAFRRQRWAAGVFQQRFRAQRRRNRDTKHYREVRNAVIRLQAAFRGMKCRRSIKQQHRAADVIQRSYRAHCERRQYLKLRLSVLAIQRKYRANLAAKAQSIRHLEMCRAAVVLQAAFRGRQVRQKVAHLHQAATVIQSVYRRHREKVKFQAMRLAAVIIQRRYRCCILQRKERQDFMMKKQSTIILQAVFRGWCVRKEMSRQNQAATVIQSVYKKHRMEIRFQAMRLAAVIIQRRYRAQVLQRQDRENFLKMRRSAVVLQAAFRGQRVRNNISKMHMAATVIQTNYRRYKQQSAFRRQRWAAGVFQQRFRAQRRRNRDTKHYREVRNAVIRLQAAFRGMKCRRSIKQQHRAADVIQRSYRAHCERRQYLALKSSVLSVQRRYRATVAAKQQMHRYQTARRAAVVLQAAFRGRQVRREIALWHQAATVIQSVYKKHRMEIRFQAMRLAAVIIQRRYRAQVLQRQDRENFLKMRRSAVVLQAAFRGQRVRNNISKMHMAATVIQTNYRRYKQQSAFRRQCWAAGVFQQRFRAQRRRNRDTKHYREVRNAVIRLQAAFRGMKCRRSIKQQHRAADVIQRSYRAHCERRQYLKLRLSVLAIQRKYRANLAAKAQSIRHLEMCRAAVVLQAAFRGRQVRQKVAHLHQAATVIQSVYRRHREKVKFQVMRLAAVIIQRRYRCCILQRKERQDFMMKKQSTIILQAVFRGWCVRKEMSRQSQAAAVIQSYRRSLVQRRIFQRKREAVVTLQRRFRATQLSRVERNNYIQTRRAAVTLQMHCRAWIARRKVLEEAKAERRLRFTSAVVHHLSAMKIQRALRAHWALEAAKRQIHSVVTVQRWVRARQQRRRYLEDRGKVVAAQRAVKRWLTRRHKAAAVIQHAVRKFLLLRRQKKVQQGIVKAQALWRGHRSRQLNDNLKVVKLRHRLRQVSAAVRDEDKLCNKTSSALDYLLKYKHFSYILEALKNLETATRLSPECCERLVESDATNIIFTLIRCCNRSVPCMDVITFSIQILLNLSKYHKTIEAVYLVENSVETLLDLLQRYREKAGDKVAEKGGSIFTKACFLLALLLQDKRRAVDVMKLPKSLDKIRSIYRLTARKHKMDAERTVMKQKINASINGSFYVQATPRKSRPTPKFAPDWVLGKDKLKDIVDPLRAIQMVAETLSIAL